jgi:hypothetical protein
MSSHYAAVHAFAAGTLLTTKVGARISRLFEGQPKLREGSVNRLSAAAFVTSGL